MSSEAIISFAIFKIFLTLGRGLAPLPDPPPARELYAPSHKCLHIENYPATPLPVYVNRIIPLVCHIKPFTVHRHLPEKNTLA